MLMSVKMEIAKSTFSFKGNKGVFSSRFTPYISIVPSHCSFIPTAVTRIRYIRLDSYRSQFQLTRTFRLNVFNLR